MGREAVVHAEAGSEAGEVRALLESTELVLRGGIRRRFRISALEGVTSEDGILRFNCAGEAVKLYLGVRLSGTWVKAISTPPPSLRCKLGLNTGAAKLIGVMDDAELAEALDGSLVEEASEATMLIARVNGPADLKLACEMHALQPDLPIWTVYPKGRGVVFADGAIRSALRARGFRDTKSCAVSDRLTATRYSPG
jgi:hypothetical protein